MSIQGASSSNSTPRWNYDVFLSFRGEDTRNNFTDHLYSALLQKGIYTFRDDEKLERGKVIACELLEAIEESRISVVVFSKNYAFSRWCLDELVKIVECMKATGQILLPVFYDVDPSHVRKQMGSVGEAFANHEQEATEEKMKKVQKWRDALAEAGNLSGWVLQQGSESELITKVVSDIYSKLDRKLLHVDENLVGMDSRLREMASRINRESTHVRSNDVRMVGIYGTGGIGKTTIAKVVYNLISGQFEGFSFLANVREVSKNRSLHYLQEQILRDILALGNRVLNNVDEGINVLKNRLRFKRVLIVLDDVDDLEQLESLAGSHDWFGPGSRIIITTRDKHLLAVHGVDESDWYEAKELDHEESFRLFSQYAFKQNHPQEDYLNLSTRTVGYARGLPLALKVLGSFLFRKTIPEWESELYKLERQPNKKIQSVLQISFDGLDRSQKEIFLDVACFFKGEDKDFVTKILDRSADSGLRVLSDRCLINILDNKLGMHDLIQQMGREIVCEKFPDEPGKRSRLWDPEDIYRVLTKISGTEAVQGIFLDLSRSKRIRFTTEAFSMMNNLRLLKVFHGSGSVPVGKDSAVQSSEYFGFPSDELRYLHWHGYPSESLPSNFNAENLVVLDMRYSFIKKLWNEDKLLEKLTFIDLSHCQHLTKIPKFSTVPNLKRLILEGCTSLPDVQSSIGVLNKLVSLNLKDCKKLRFLPSTICHLESLRFLSLSGCSELKKFPDIQQNMECLLELYLDGTAIKELPTSLEHIPGLVLLDLKSCNNLKSLPSSICKLKSLKSLTLSGCSKLASFPEIIENMEHLARLHLDGTAIRELSLSIENLKGLVLLNLRNCDNLESLPNNICNLKSLETLTVSGCSKLDKLPEDLGNLQCLVELHADGTAIRQPPSSIVLLRNLEVLTFSGSKGPVSKSWRSVFSLQLLKRENSTPISLQLPSVSGLVSLRELDLSDCNLKDLPSDLCCLSSLQVLDLSKNNIIRIPEGISRLSKLNALRLEHCKGLVEIPELPPTIERITANDCTSLETLSFPSSMCKLPESSYRGLQLILDNCFKLAKNQSSNVLGAMLQKFEEFFPEVGFKVILPGNGIPQWFQHQNMGPSVRIELPPNWYNKFKGFAVCFVFSLDEKIHSDPGMPICELTSDVGDIGLIHDFLAWEKGGRKGRSIGSDHVWLAYEPWDLLSEVNWSLHPSKWTYINALFDIELVAGPVMVKKCGVRLLYARDHEDSYPTMMQYSPSVIEETKVKRSRGDTEAIGSGSSSSSDEDPQPKRLRGSINEDPKLKFKGNCSFQER